MGSLEFREKDFVHLHLHSDYSLLTSAIQLKPLAAKLAANGMSACAVTDLGNMYGAVTFYQTMKKAQLRPIIGYEAFVATKSRYDRDIARDGSKPFHNLVLLAKNYKGYLNLVHLASKAFTEGLHLRPQIDFDLLAEYADGLIALSGGRDGAIPYFLLRGDTRSALNYAGKVKDIFGDKNVFLEIQDHGLEDDPGLIAATRELSRETGISLVACNEAQYLAQEDARAHEVLLCIGEGRTITDARYTLRTPSYYVRSTAEMWSLFGSEFPEALTNTLRIAERCDLDLSEGGKLTLPTFPIPPEFGSDSVDAYFEHVVREGYAERKRTVFEPMEEAGTLRHTPDVYEARLDREIATIRQMGFSGYFLIVWEFVKYAIESNIPVGVGRGSAAGSLVAYCLGITGIDPIQYELLFERFLNPERISMPDIDIDFCIKGRGAVIDHVTQVYGRESVCQIITFGTMASRAAIKDVGRVLNMPYGDVERIAKLIPPPFRGRNISISQALEQVPELKTMFQNDASVRDLLDLALRLEGCSRHSSVHAAGVVISPKPLHELVPVAISSKNELTSQYSMTDLEKVGMLKMDFLALTTLTIIDDCLASLREKLGIEIDWNSLSLSDELTMKVFCEGRTDAVFQFESSGMQEICRKLKPEGLEDLSALNALYRPGPLDGGMIDDFIARRRGEKQVRYLVPEMKEILDNTYGVLVYQEQIMQLAQRLGGYSLGEADLMRRAMGKKKPEEMAPHETKFVAGAVERGISKDKAKEIFDLMAKFADYGFNRSHSVAYAYLAFQTGYLKAHYPSFFYASVLSHESDNSAKVYKYSNELRTLGTELLPPDVNESDEGFTPTRTSVRFGLSAIKGIGSSTIRAILESRKSGRFTSIFDFTGRVDQSCLNRRALEGLVFSGAFDSMMPEGTTSFDWRPRLFASIDDAVSFGQRTHDDRDRGQTGLFGGESNSNYDPTDRLREADAWTQAEMAQNEKTAIGFYLSAHPLDAYKEISASLGLVPLREREDPIVGERLRIAGVVSALQVRYSKKGNRYASFRVEDVSGGVKCLAWSEAFSKFSGLISDDAVLIVEGKIEAVDAQDVTVIIDSVENLADARSKGAREACITLPYGVTEERLSEIFALLNERNGRCDVVLKLPLEAMDVVLESPMLRVNGSSSLDRELTARGCKVEWSFLN